MQFDAECYRSTAEYFGQIWDFEGHIDKVGNFKGLKKPFLNIEPILIEHNFIYRYVLSFRILIGRKSPAQRRLLTCYSRLLTSRSLPRTFVLPIVSVFYRHRIIFSGIFFHRRLFPVFGLAQGNV